MSRYMCLSILESEEEYVDKVMASLSSKIRRNILRLINEQSYNISEIAQKLNMPLSSAAFHVKNLQEADLINVQERPAAHGMTKIISRKVDEINIKCAVPPDVLTTSITRLNIPIGSFTDCRAVASCGMASEEKLIEVDDMPGVFYSVERCGAQIIWFAEGYLEYRVPNYYLIDQEAIELIFSMEICSEAPNYRNDWTSDITFWVNGMELCTWTSPGDFGGRRGRLNPAWWSDVSSQYGLLKTVRVNGQGVYVDENKMASIRISDLRLEQGNYFTLRVGVKPDAENCGGLNLFGEKFGDYEQAIAVRVEHRTKK